MSNKAVSKRKLYVITEGAIIILYCHINVIYFASDDYTISEYEKNAKDTILAANTREEDILISFPIKQSSRRYLQIIYLGHSKHLINLSRRIAQSTFKYKRPDAKNHM